MPEDGPLLDRLKFRRSNIPAYKFVVRHRPPSANSSSDSREVYKEAVASRARQEIAQPIASRDVQVEVTWASHTREGSRADVDNILKPTLDALNNLAYADDKQVHAVSSMVIDLTGAPVLPIAGHVEDLVELLNAHGDAVQIAIFSDTRLAELGGAQLVEERRRIDHMNRFPGNVGFTTTASATDYSPKTT
ncbi:MAG: RusA family crossover junction endodeoxyribonuclease [Planctomycetota bacterium]